MMERIGHIAVTRPRGSALILTVVLTSLLAIVGVLFVMAARIDKMASTATMENHELTCAIDTVLTRIEQDLTEDIPGVTADQEYYDYPDDDNRWLADLEPYVQGSGGNAKYYWRQISNPGGILTSGTKDILIDKNKDGFVGERDAVLNPTGAADPNVLADADGDGVADAKWFQVPGVMTSKGKRFYAAVRIVDNGGMLNVNTGYWLDPNDPDSARVDGSSPLQVNVVALAAAPGDQPLPQNRTVLLGTRANQTTNPTVAMDLARYEREVIWQYLDVKNSGVYTPFDMSDELELRYRHLLDQAKTNTRVENWGRFRQDVLSTPADGPADVNAWFPRVTGGTDPSYAYRHVATTYNMDRIVMPESVDPNAGTRLRKMVNVNTMDEATLRKAVYEALREADPSPDPGITAQTAAQITANLRDYIDDDDDVTVIDELSSAYYGFERPCIYISEIACQQRRDQAGALHSSYAIELYRPYFEDGDPKAEEWTLVIPGTPETRLSVTWSGSRRFHVILAEDSQASVAPQPALSGALLAFQDAEEPADTMPLYGYNRKVYPEPQRADFKFNEGTTISLERNIPDSARVQTVDQVKVPAGWLREDGVARSIQRDISPHKCIRRLWAPVTQVSTPALGNSGGNYVDVQRPEIVQAHPANRPLTNIGELGRIFRESAFNPMVENPVEAEVLIDLANPAFSRLFNYLTVIDPVQRAKPDTVDEFETRIMGRININTAPAFVLAQLPWLAYAGPNDVNAVGGAAQAGPGGNSFYSSATALQRGGEIVKHRELQGPYRSVGDLMQVGALRTLAFDVTGNGRNETPRGPDLTPDTALNDFEERDLLFTRISDLVTVRSDVFTAYILVRIGEAGPQKRLVAIFDRSRADSAGGKVRIIAQHPVPDPR